MGAMLSMCEVRWERYPRVAESAHSQAWLRWQCNRGLAANTLEAYGRGLERHLLFLAGRELAIEAVTRLDIAAYVRDLLAPGLAARDSLRTKPCSAERFGRGQSGPTISKTALDSERRTVAGCSGSCSAGTAAQPCDVG